MASTKKKIAVVGGGFAGLLSVYCLKEEGGFEPICFEKTGFPVGTWCYREEVEEGVPSIMPTTIINHSKEMGALSDSPPPKELSIFMRHNELYQYALSVVKKRDVLDHVKYNMEVLNVKRADDYEETGRWIVTMRNTISGERISDIYDGVIVAIGQFNRPILPSYPSQETFKGKIMHTHSLKGVEPYRNKRIAVVGMGCSALDAAVETSNVAKQVYISTRSGAHVIPRVGPHGYPFDWTVLRRWIFFIFLFPRRFASWCFECIYLDPQFNHNIYNVKPKYHIFSKDPVINDHIGSKLLSGLVIMKPDIQCFTEDGVIFEGDTEVTKADVIIMATGYTWKFPFLEEGIIVQDEGRIDLYKLIFPVHLKHSTLAIIGFVLPFGPGFPIGELQCRWAAQVLAKNCKLPSKEVMLQDVIDRYTRNAKSYPSYSDKTILRVDYIPYCDEIASQFGAKPNLLKIFITDPKLFMKLFFGPSLSYQYRLQGPHSWKGAREAIMTSEERMLYPLTKKLPEKTDGNIFVFIFKKLLTLIFF